MGARQPDLLPFLDALTRKYNRAELLGSDPLQLVHEFRAREVQEIASLFCALLAYGNVKQILASLRRLFDAMGSNPARFILRFNFEQAQRALRGFKHRFTDEEDVLCL